MKWGRELAFGHDLSSIRLLGSVGEPINPGLALVSDDLRPRHRADRRHVVADRDRGRHDLAAAGRDELQAGIGHASAARHLSQDRRRRRQRSWSRLPTVANTLTGYLVLETSRGRPCCAASGVIPSGSGRRTGPGSPSRAGTSPVTAPATAATARSGCSGRIDDVMNVSGATASPAEVRSALVGHAGVAGGSGGYHRRPHRSGDLRVRHPQGARRRDVAGADGRELRAEVAQEISPIAKPREITWFPAAEDPQRQIMRRLLRDVAGPRTRRYVNVVGPQGVRGDPRQQ